MISKKGLRHINIIQGKDSWKINEQFCPTDRQNIPNNGRTPPTWKDETSKYYVWSDAANFKWLHTLYHGGFEPIPESYWTTLDSVLLITFTKRIFHCINNLHCAVKKSFFKKRDNIILILYFPINDEVFFLMITSTY